MDVSRMATARLVFVAAFSAGLPLSSAQKPRELLHMEEMRKQISSAEVEYVAQTIDGPKFKSARLFAGDFLTVNFGDEDGWTNSEKGSRYSYSRVFEWATSDGHYYHYLDGWVTMLAEHPEQKIDPKGSAAWDIRTLGLETRPVVGRPIGKYANVDPAVARYEVHDIEDGMVEVRCFGTDQFPVERVWRLDSNNGYRPVVVQQIVDGEVLEEARSYYDDTDGMSVLPSRVEYSVPNATTTQIDVFSATINEPYHREITFADFPLFAGVRLSGPRTNKVWDGGSFVSPAEFSERVGKGEIDATALRKAARAMSADASPTPFSGPEARGRWIAREADAAKPQMWARYVRSFLVKHRAEKEVRKLAWRLHKGCLEAVQEFVDRRDSVKKPESQVGRLEIAKLEEVLTKVFETRLKPGLERLVK